MIWLVSLLLWGVAAAAAGAASDGDRLFAAGDYAGALAAYAEEVATHPEAPDLPDTFLKMARCHLRLHRPWLAEVRLRRILADDLESDAAAAAVGLLDRLLDQRQRWEEALHLADTFLARQPVRARLALLAMRAHALVALGRHQEAMGAFATLHRALPAAARPAVEAEVERWLATRPEPFLRWVIRKQGTAFPADYALLALIDRYREGEPELARRLTDQFLDTFPDHPRAAGLRQPPSPPVEVFVQPPPAITRRYDPERIDLLLPTTGPLAEVGIALFQGATLAVEGYNAERDREAPGAIQVTLTLHDTGSTESGAERALQGILDREPLPLAVVGPATSPACRRLAPLAAAAGLPLITPSAAAPDLPFPYPYLFRVGMSDASQVARLLDYAVGERGARTLACLYPNNGYGAHFRDLFVERARCLGAEVVAQASYPPDGVDFGRPIRNLLAQEQAANARLVADRPFVPESPDSALPRLPWLPDGTLLPGPVATSTEPPPPPDGVERSSGIDAVFLPGPAATVGLVMAQLTYYGVEEAVWLATEDAATPELIERGERFARKAAISSGFFPAPGSPAAAFAAAYRKRFGADPDRLAAQAYQAVRVILTGLDQGVRSGPDLAAFLGRGPDLDGLAGPLTVDVGGEIAIRPTLITVRRHRFVVLPEGLPELTSWSPPAAPWTVVGPPAAVWQLPVAEPPEPADQATPTPEDNPEGMAPGLFKEDRWGIPIP